MFQVLSHSHRLHDLLYEYPIDLVLNLYQAEIANRQDELKAKMAGQAMAVSRAIENAMDLLLNKGEGEILSHWFKALDGHPNGQKETPARPVSIPPGTRKFFAGAPIVMKTKG